VYGNRYGMRSEREEQFVKYSYPAEGAAKIHLIWTDSPSWITCWNDGNDFIRALRDESIEFVFCQHPGSRTTLCSPTSSCPSTPSWKKTTSASDVFSGQLDLPLPGAPLHRVPGRVGERLRDRLQDRRAPGTLGGVHGRDGIPRDHQAGYETSGCDKISWERPAGERLLRDPAGSRVGEDPSRPHPVLQGPKGHPLSTPPASWSSTPPACRALPEDPERPPVPHWVAQGESHQETRGTERAKKYPLLVVSNHPAGGALPARRRHLVSGAGDLQDPGS